MACKFKVTDPVAGIKEFETEDEARAYVKENISNFRGEKGVDDPNVTSYDDAKEKFVSRWKLKPIMKMGEFGYTTKDGKATRQLAEAMAKQLSEKSGYLYDNLHIRYNATLGLIQISPKVRNRTESDMESPVDDIDVNGERRFDPLHNDFSKIPNSQNQATVLSYARIKDNTYIKNGEHYNVERIRHGTSEEIGRKMGVNQQILKDAVKYSNIGTAQMNKIFDPKSGEKVYAYKVSKVTDTKQFINPEEDTITSKLRRFKQNDIVKINERIRKAKDTHDRAELYKEKARIEKQIVELDKAKNQNIGFLKDLYDADKLEFETKDLSNRADVEYQKNLFRGYELLFTGLDLKVFGSEIENEFKEAIKDAKRIQEELADKLTEVVIKQIQPKLGEKIADENANLYDIKDIGILEENLLSIANTTNNPVVKYIAQTSNFALNRAKDRTNRKQNEIRKATEALIDWGKKNGLKGIDIYNYLLEEDENGKPNGHFVVKHGRFYSRLYSIIKDGKSDRDQISNFMSFLKTNTQSLENKEEAFKEEWDKIYQRVYEKIMEGTEDVQYATEEAVRSANAISALINPTNFLKIMDSYKATNKLSEQEIGFVKAFINRDGFRKFIKIHPKEEFRDPKYKAIEALEEHHPQKVFYKLFSEFHYHVNNRVRIDDGSTLRRNFIAEYKKDYKDKDESLFDYLKKTAVDKTIQLFTESPKDNIKGIDPITGEILRTIPFYSFDGRMDAKDKNYNLGKVLMNLTKDFYKYEALTEIEPDLLAADHILRNTKTQETNSIGKRLYDNEGNAVFSKGTSSISKQLDYFILATLYNQRMKKEGVGGKHYHDFEIQKRLDELDKIKEQEGNLTSEEAKEYEDLSKRYTVITGKKTFNSILQFTSIKNIGFNIFSGAAEFLQANASVYLRYGGKKYFSTVWGDTLALLNPMDSAKKQKLEGLKNMFNVMGDVNSEMNESKFKKAAYLSFAPARAVGNTAYLVATLKDQKIKDKEGKEHNLYNVIDFNEDGQLIMPETFVNPFYNEKGEESEYKYKIGQILAKELRDNRDRENDIDPIKFNEMGLGRLLGQFKSSWLFQGINTRFGGERQGVNDLDKASKGIYRSLWDISTVHDVITDSIGNTTREFNTPKTILNVFKNLVRYSSFGRLTKAGKQKEGMSDVDYNGAIRTVREIQTAIFLYGIVMLVSLARGDDKDKSWRRATTYALNLFQRYQRDMTTYLSPASLASIANKNAIPSLSTITDMVKIIEDPFIGVLSDKWYYNQGKSNEQLRITRDMEDMVPILNQMRKTLNKLDKNQGIFYDTGF